MCLGYVADWLPVIPVRFLSCHDVPLSTLCKIIVLLVSYRLRVRTKVYTPEGQIIHCQTTCTVLSTTSSKHVYKFKSILDLGAPTPFAPSLVMVVFSLISLLHCLLMDVFRETKNLKLFDARGNGSPWLHPWLKWFYL